jgi:hypothetical protein
MSTVPTYNLTIIQGSEDSCSIQFMVDEDTARDLTGATIECQLRQRPKGELVDTLTVANDRIEIVDAEEGRIKLLFPAATTSDYKIFNGTYDIEITISGETKRRLMGNWSLDLETTKI